MSLTEEDAKISRVLCDELSVKHSCLNLSTIREGKDLVLPISDKYRCTQMYIDVTGVTKLFDEIVLVAKSSCCSEEEIIQTISWELFVILNRNSDAASRYELPLLYNCGDDITKKLNYMGKNLNYAKNTGHSKIREKENESARLINKYTGSTWNLPNSKIIFRNTYADFDIVGKIITDNASNKIEIEKFIKLYGSVGFDYYYNVWRTRYYSVDRKSMSDKFQDDGTFYLCIELKGVTSNVMVTVKNASVPIEYINIVSSPDTPERELLYFMDGDFARIKSRNNDLNFYQINNELVNWTTGSLRLGITIDSGASSSEIFTIEVHSLHVEKRVNKLSY